MAPFHHIPQSIISKVGRTKRRNSKHPSITLLECETTQCSGKVVNRGHSTFLCAEFYGSKEHPLYLRNTTPTTYRGIVFCEELRKIDREDTLSRKVMLPHATSKRSEPLCTVCLAVNFCFDYIDAIAPPSSWKV